MTWETGVRCSSCGHNHTWFASCGRSTRGTTGGGFETYDAPRGVHPATRDRSLPPFPSPPPAPSNVTTEECPSCGASGNRANELIVCPHAQTEWHELLVRTERARDALAGEQRDIAARIDCARRDLEILQTAAGECSIHQRVVETAQRALDELRADAGRIDRAHDHLVATTRTLCSMATASPRQQ